MAVAINDGEDEQYSGTLSTFAPEQLLDGEVRMMHSHANNAFPMAFVDDGIARRV